MAGATSGVGGGGGGSSAVKFVGSDADGLPLKRKQVPQACLSCRKKKKRCVHAISPDSKRQRHSTSPFLADHPPHRPQTPSVPVSSPQRRRSEASAATAPRQGEPTRFEEDSCQVAATQLVELSSRFVGDLNPEGVFIVAATPQAAKKEALARGQNKIGIWLPAGPEAGADTIRSPELTAAYRGRGGSINGSSGGGGPLMHRSPEDGHGVPVRSRGASELQLAFESARARYLSEECLVTVPPPQDYDALRRIFLDKIYPILPIFTDAHLAVGASAGNTDAVYATLVKQVVSLAAALDPCARRHLRLRAGGPLLSPQDFHQQLSGAIFPVLEAGWVPRRVDHIRLLVILALFYQQAGPSDRHRHGQLANQAVNLLHGLGAHLEGYCCMRPDEDIDRVFCAVWAMDTLCAALNSRPTGMHERDIQRDIDAAINKQPPVFQLFLRILRTLDSVFPLYRPHQPFVYIEVPIFESLIMDTGTGRSPTRLLATLETLYHAVAVLSCRQQRSYPDTAPENDRSHLPDPAINPRLSLSADRIIWVVQNEELAPFPFVPYAVSLALSVQYRKMRYSRTLMFRNRARGLFQEIVRELDRLGDIFYSAKVNAGLGESILREMEQTATNLCSREEVDNGSTTASAATGPSGQGGPSSGRTDTVVAAPAGAAAAGPMAATAAGLPDSTTATGTTAATTTTTATTGATVGATAAVSTDGGHLPSGPSGTVNMEPSVFDNLDVDVDLFGYFDPNFNLGAVDTALEANLNMGFPLTWAGEPWNLAGA